MLLTDVSLLTRVDFDFLKKKKRKRKIDFELRSFIWCSVGILYMFELLVAFWSEAKRIRKYIYIYSWRGRRAAPSLYDGYCPMGWSDFSVWHKIPNINYTTSEEKKRWVKIWPPQVFDCFIGRLLLRGYEALPCLHHPHLLPWYSHHFSIMTLYQMQNKIK